MIIFTVSISPLGLTASDVGILREAIKVGEETLLKYITKHLTTDGDKDDSPHKLEEPKLKQLISESNGNSIDHTTKTFNATLETPKTVDSNERSINTNQPIRNVEQEAPTNQGTMKNNEEKISNEHHQADANDNTNDRENKLTRNQKRKR